MKSVLGPIIITTLLITSMCAFIFMASVSPQEVGLFLLCNDYEETGDAK